MGYLFFCDPKGVISWHKRFYYRKTTPTGSQVHRMFPAEFAESTELRRCPFVTALNPQKITSSTSSYEKILVD
jgi:hypothetical protein